MKKVPFFIILFLLLLTSCSEENSEIKVVTVEEMETILELEDVQLLDVRSNSSYESGHIEKAQNIDFNSPTFEKDIEKLDKDKSVVVYCNKGIRSAKCAKKLLEAGFVKIYDLEGGYSKWIHENLNSN